MLFSHFQVESRKREDYTKWSVYTSQAAELLLLKSNQIKHKNSMLLKLQNLDIHAELLFLHICY